VLAAQAMGADLAYVGTRFIATREANARPEYKQMLIDTSAADIVYTSLFSGVLANYLKPSVAAAGHDPDNLPTGDKSKMNFGSTGKAWRDIWSAGHGVGSISDVPTVADCVARLREEYAEAARRLTRTEHWPAAAASS
jgi:nitronate monooxygenase